MGYSLTCPIGESKVAFLVILSCYKSTYHDFDLVMNSESESDLGILGLQSDQKFSMNKNTTLKLTNIPYYAILLLTCPAGQIM